MSHFQTNAQLTSFFQKKDNQVKEKSVIIMDEVDGMSGDKGGTLELVKQIKNANRPIICICNDRDKQSIKTLR